MKKKIIAINIDGFGARFAAIINAIRISKSMDLEFCFTWESRGGNKDLFHTVEDREKIFDQDFIKKYCLNNIDGIQVGNFKDYFINKENFDYFRSYSTMPFFNSALKEFKFEFNKELFYQSNILDFIGFTPKYRQILKDVDDIAKALSGYTAVHIRGGDVIQKDNYNSRISLIFKTLPLALLVFLHMQKNSKYLFFIQDECVEVFYKKKYNINTASDFYPKDRVYDRYEKAFFDIILMSKCREIIAPHSGFSLSASYLSNQDILSYRTLFSGHQITNIIKNYLKNDSNDIYTSISNKHIAFEILSLLFYGKNILTQEEYLYWCDKGYQYNLKNSIFVLLKIFCLLYYEKFNEAREVVLKECFCNEYKFEQTLMAIKTNTHGKIYFDTNTFFLEAKKNIFKCSDEIEILFFIISLEHENNFINSFIQQYDCFLFLDMVCKIKIAEKIKEYIKDKCYEDLKQVLENHIDQFDFIFQKSFSTFQTKYGTAKQRIQNQLSYKLGQ
ncbi:hypothetical protein LZW12_08900, partial [Campylobacter coli]|nr:hypothetical protein [Campylobacter coli]MCE7263817.1 hypothetical protein [Campylobacter coli]